MEVRGQTTDEMTQNLGKATQKLVQLTDQNALLHQALKRAKEVSARNLSEILIESYLCGSTFYLKIESSRT
jgi:hypothetical protein